MPGPEPAGCHVCGGRAPYGYHGDSFCAAHLPAAFWAVKRRAESPDQDPAGDPRPRRSKPDPKSDPKTGQGRLF